MTHAVFNSLARAEAYVAAVDAHEGYPRAGNPEAPYPLGWTETWAVPRAHPEGGRWAVLLHPVVAPDDADSVEVLDGSWEVVL